MDIRNLWIECDAATDRRRDPCAEPAQSGRIRWLLQNKVTNFTGFALGMVIVAMESVAQHSDL